MTQLGSPDLGGLRTLDISPLKGASPEKYTTTLLSPWVSLNSPSTDAKRRQQNGPETKKPKFFQQRCLSPQALELFGAMRRRGGRGGTPGW